MSKELYELNKPSFYSKVMKILKSYTNVNNELNELESITIHQQSQFILSNAKNKYVTFWKHKLDNSSKLSFYSTFKSEYKLEDYLTTIRNASQRKAATKFRISCHKLQIKYGRYHNIPREQRLCINLYDTNEIEDEYHFALSCNYYREDRNSTNNILQRQCNETPISYPEQCLCAG